MPESDTPSSASRSSRRVAQEGESPLLAARLNLWSALGVAAITGILGAVTAYIVKPDNGEGASGGSSPSVATEKASVSIDPVAGPVGLCNIFAGTGNWDADKSVLMLFNRPWDKRVKDGTGNFYFDGPATRLSDGTWKGPRQELGRDTERGFAVEVAAAVVSRPWADFMKDDLTGPDEQYWAVKKLPPHEAVATIVVTRDGTTDAAC